MLSSAIEAAIAQLPSTTDRHDDFVDLLTNLKCFGQQQFNYFLGETQAHPNREVAGFTGEAALTATLHQIGYDLAAITQAASQRQTAPGNTGSDITTLQADIESVIALRLADHIAEEMLKPAIQQGMLEAKAPLFEPPKALTYFQKSPSVRVLPYSRIALIGVPYSIIDYQQRSVSIDLLAIPHEVGHYVYWKGHGKPIGTMTGRKKVSFFQLVSKAFADQGSAIPGWLKRWGEEIFADVYAAFVAGSIIGIDFQDLMIESNTISELEEDDRDHPTPLVRPEIFEHVLRWRVNSNTADTLKARWQAKLKERYGHTAMSLKSDDDDMLVWHSKSLAGPIPLSYMRNRLEHAVDVVHELLVDSKLGLYDFTKLDVYIEDSNHKRDNLNPDTIGDELINAWDAAVAKVREKIPVGLDNLSMEPPKRETPEQECVVWNSKNWNKWRYALLKEHEIVWGSGKAVTEDSKWIVILQAGGWTTEGPQSNPPV